MGGAACWQYAAHFAGKWAAAAPGAGFSETADFLKVFQNEKVQPTAYEQKLWHMYDCTDYAVNIFNCPTVAYSGEIDKQKQAADMMAAAMLKEGLELTHLIGPKTAHAYEKATKEELIKRIDAIAEKGRNPVPKKIRFTTWTLIYNEMLWVTVEGMGQHWERARVDAELGDGDVTAKTVNVTGLTFSMGAGPVRSKPARRSRSRSTTRRSRRPRRARTSRGRRSSTRTAPSGSPVPCPTACARSPAFRARSTTPSWTASSWSSRPASRSTTRSASGPRRRWSTRSRTGASSIAATRS
jgi:hypothetical protein